MRPIAAVVINSESGCLTLRLKTGGVVKVGRREDLKFGDKCWIGFDYTQMAVAHVWTPSEMVEKDPPSEEPSLPDDPDAPPVEWLAEEPMLS